MSSDTLCVAPRARTSPGAPPAARGHTLRGALRSLRDVLHRVLGVPDYEGYVRHLRTHHPDAPVPSARDFERERLSARYERPGSRCC